MPCQPGSTPIGILPVSSSRLELSERPVDPTGCKSVPWFSQNVPQIRWGVQVGCLNTMVKPECFLDPIGCSSVRFKN